MKKILVGALVLLVALAGCTKKEEEKIKIGVAGPHSGDLAPYGIPTKQAAEMLAEKTNAAGGINGKMIELIPMDDQCKPEIAVNVATNLVSQGAKVIIGHVCSGATKAALGIYKESGAIAISPSATNPPLTKSGDYPNFYRTIAADDEQGKLAADFVTEKLGAKKVAVLHDKGDYGKGFADFSKQFIEETGKAEVVLYEGITPGAIDYSAVIEKLKASAADVVVYGGYHPEASKLIGLINKKNIEVDFVGPDGIKGEGFLEIAGDNAEGVYATGPMDVSKFEANKEARAAFKEKYGKEPGTFFDQGYAAMQAALNAIEVSGGTDVAGLEKALKSSMVDTAVGKIKFDAKGDAVGVGFSVYQVRDGEFVEVE
ncbi:MAG: branched-chain amino acid ABC transporter substrate-binding protein [Desulfuromonadales bacterium]|nr:branched-chain amino acid ABC transporter substrate-binding protein [Desulfuromonadales bacterium]NIS39494.1 branched-chain amino acid ABC transporter substrate-binding protein [Desulfuromonadales bacterium]